MITRKKILPWTFIFTILFLVLSTANPVLAWANTEHAPQEKSSWTITLTTSGGFSGGGMGTLALDSQGTLVVNRQTLRPPRPTCKTTLSPETLHTLDESLSDIKSNSWNKKRLDAAAPDAFRYDLELRTRTDTKTEQAYTLTWYDNTAANLPSDLVHVTHILMQAWQDACRN